MIFNADSRLVADVRPAANVESRKGVKRPSIIVMHYTGMSCAAKAIDWLACAESHVSCHYVIDEAGRITQMVPESQRAWHAGVSFWRGERDINSHSIGIEIQNPGHQHGYPDFPEPQMAAIVSLSRDIAERNRIAPDGVLAHSDVAPERKIDPGEKFDWTKLAEHGLGDWVPPSPLHDGDHGLGIGAKGDIISNAQAHLAAYGYDIAPNGEIDTRTSHVIRAFQLHFRQKRVDGRLDRSTITTLERLVAAAKRTALV